jgi:hypothetical protein
MACEGERLHLPESCMYDAMRAHLVIYCRASLFLFAAVFCSVADSKRV